MNANKHSKTPIIKQMRAMASALRKKFKTSANIEIACWSFDTENDQEQTTYRIFVANNIFSASFSSWELLLEQYNKLMEKADV